MTRLQCARQEWEDKTTPNPKNHPIGKKIHVHEFRKFGQAIAWLKWESDDYIEFTKIEKLPGAGRSAATPLVGFLKTLADKYKVRLFGNATVYQPDPPVPEGPLPSQGELEAWYKKHGFQLRKIGGTDGTAISYPDFPPVSTG